MAYGTVHIVGANPVMKEFVESLDIESRLDPRETFFGGHCNAVKLYATMKGDEKIKYVDLTSLYTKFTIGIRQYNTTNQLAKGGYWQTM